MKTIHPGHLEHRFCIFGCQILCITDLAIMHPEVPPPWQLTGINIAGRNAPRSKARWRRKEDI